MTLMREYGEVCFWVSVAALLFVLIYVSIKAVDVEERKMRLLEQAAECTIND